MKLNGPRSRRRGSGGVSMTSRYVSGRPRSPAHILGGSSEAARQDQADHIVSWTDSRKALRDAFSDSRSARKGWIVAADGELAAADRSVDSDVAAWSTA